MLTAEEIKLRKDLYTAGKTDAEIAEIVHCCPKAIELWRKRSGLPTKKRWNTQMSEDALKEVKMLYDRGMNDRQIAIRVGVYPSTVARWRYKSGFPKN